MIEIIPRFEFHIFAHDLASQREKLYQLATFAEYEEQEDVYLITADNHNHNIKVRDGRLGIKRLIQKKEGLEQWQPIFQTSFPLTSSQIRWELFASLNVITPPLQYDSYNQELFWEELIKPRRSICLAHVTKHRSRYNYGSCQAEFTHFWANGSPMQTLAIKDEDQGAVQQLRTKLGLQAYANMNYPLALERLINVPPHFAASDAWLAQEGGK
jgi:hypothetical protein